jgi:hypothetical protein
MTIIERNASAGNYPTRHGTNAAGAIVTIWDFLSRAVDCTEVRR